MAKLGDICEIINGYSFQSVKYVSSGIRIIRIANVQKGYIEDTTPVFYPLDTKGIEKYILNENDLLISLTGNVGRVALLNKEFLPAALNQRVACLRIKKGILYDIDFLYCFLNSDSFENKCIASSKGVAQKNMSTEWLKEIDIPDLNLNKQKEITIRLNEVDSLIYVRKQQLEKLDELVKSRFIEMFGDPVRNEKNWPLVTLEDVAEIRIGPFGTLLHKEDYIIGGHALVNPSHIVDGNICIDEKLTVSDEKYDELSAYHLSIGDVVLGRRGEMGRCAVVHDEGLLCGTGSMVIRPTEKMKSYFLKNIISSPAYKKIIEEKAVGVTMMNLNVPIVSSLTIPLLPLNLQEHFIAFMQQVDKSKFEIKRSLEKLELLKKALMQKYFG